ESHARRHRWGNHPGRASARVRLVPASEAMTWQPRGICPRRQANLRKAIYSPGERQYERRMEAIHNVRFDSLLDTLVSLTAAFVLGGLIGLERQYRQRTAGLRTNVLVAVGAAIFVDMANRLYGHEGAIRVTSYVVSGIGFLGAGVIMRGESNVRGLNTAATL